MIKLGEPYDVDLDKIVIASLRRHDKFARVVSNSLGKGWQTDRIMDPRVFTGREFGPKFNRDIEGKNVYIIAPNNPWRMGPQGKVKRMEMVADAAKSNGADIVTAVPLDLNYSRQDRFFKGEARSARLQAKTFKAAGVDRVLTVHLHSSRTISIYGEVYFENEIERKAKEMLSEYTKVATVIDGHIGKRDLVDFLDLARPGKRRMDEETGKWIYEKKEYFDFDNKKEMKEVKKFYAKYEAVTLEAGKRVMHNLNPAPLLAHYLLTDSMLTSHINPEDGSNICVVYSDEGARPFGESVKHHLFLPGIQDMQVKKFRQAPNDPNKIIAEIDYEHSNFTNLNNVWILLPDDGTETAGTLAKAVEAFNNEDFIKEYGRPAGIILYFTHAWLNGQNYEPPQTLLADIGPVEVITTNTNTNIEDHLIPQFEEKGTILRLAKYIAHAIKYGYEAGQNLDDVFTFNTREELDRIKMCYVLKRSRELHPRELAKYA